MTRTHSRGANDWTASDGDDMAFDRVCGSTSDNRHGDLITANVIDNDNVIDATDRFAARAVKTTDDIDFAIAA